jgi:hypothetical protein
MTLGSPAELVLNNLRLRLAALEEQMKRVVSQFGDSGETTDGKSNDADVDPAPFPQLKLEARLGSIQELLNAKPTLAGPATDCSRKLAFITKERKTWIQKGNPVGVDLDAVLDPESPSSSLSKQQGHPKHHSSSNDLAMLLHYARDEYLRDLSTLRAFALSRDGAEQMTQWRRHLPDVVSHIRTLSSTSLAAAPPSPSSALSSPSQGGERTSVGPSVCDILQHDVTFQVNGETKNLDDLAELLHSNAQRVARLEARWKNLHQAFQSTVTWANRSLCAADMSLEAAECFA